jgi:hypothetical protein
MLYPLRRFMTNPLLIISQRLIHRHAIRFVLQLLSVLTRTIGQKTSTYEQDGNRSREAKFITARDVTDQGHPYLAANLPRIPEAWRASKLAQIGSRAVAYRFGQTKPREMPMKSLISRAMCHPLVALSMFFLTELLHNADYSPAGALLVLAAKSMSRVVRLFNKG